MTATAEERSTEAVVGELRAAREARAERGDAVAAYGEATLDRVVAAHEEATAILDQYGDGITGTGDFERYIEFQGRVGTLVDDLPENLPARDAFEEFADALHRQTLRGKDVRRARAALDDAADLVDLRTGLADARERVRDAERRATERLDALDDRIERLETVCSFADVDPDTDVGALRDPIDAYDAAVRADFEAFLAEASARRVVAFLDAAADYPLVDYDPVPDDMRDYLASHDVGTETVGRLLEYADYSPSKVGHYVADTEAFRRRVGANRVHLSRLDAGPLTIAWPPPPADRVRWRVRELVPVVDRFGSAETLAALRAVRDRARERRYPDLRRAARVREELSETERERLHSGAAEAELTQLREERDRLRAALDG